MQFTRRFDEQHEPRRTGEPEHISTVLDGVLADIEAAITQGSNFVGDIDVTERPLSRAIDRIAAERDALDLGLTR